MRYLILLFLASCAAPLVIARVETDGAATVAFDSNSYVVFSQADGFAQLRDTSGLPIYQIEFDPGVLIVGHIKDPKVTWRGDPTLPIPLEVWPWVQAVLTPAEIAALALSPESSGPTL